MATTAIPLGALAKCLNAPPSRVGSTTRKVVQQALSDYKPGEDFWKWIRDKGITKDRAGSRDGQAVMNAALTVTDERKKPHYLAIAHNWPAIAKRWSKCVPEKVVPGTTAVGGLPIRVAPIWGERRENGELEILFIWFNLEPLSTDAINAILRVMQRANPGAIATFVDARNPANTRTSKGKSLARYDDWLDQTGLYIANILDDAA